MATRIVALKRSIPRLRSRLLPPFLPSHPVATSSSIPSHVYTWDPHTYSLSWTTIVTLPTVAQDKVRTNVQHCPLQLSRLLSTSAPSSASEGKSSNEQSIKNQDLRATSFREIMASVPTAPSLPMILGVAGAVPFLALTPPFPSFLPLPEALSANPIEAQALYGAVILSFLGGPHWGLAMVGIHASPNHRVFNVASNSLRYLWSVVPSLLAWPALLMSTIPKLQFLICSFGLALAVDIFFYGHGLTPPWYLPLRLLLSGIVILCLTASYYEVLLVEKESSKIQPLTPEAS